MTLFHLSFSNISPDECLFQQRQLATFDPPEDGNLKSLQGWLADSKRGDYALTGADRDVWKDSKDLLVICPDHLNDSFTRLLPKPVVECYHRFFDAQFRSPSDEENGLYIYDDKKIVRAADIIGTLIASLMPILAVVVLYSIHDMWTRLGMIALFTILLSLGLVIITKGRRIEIFAATAAYVYPTSIALNQKIANNYLPRFASVMVVFVGSTSI
jgi:hypothetical protein